ncbi:MAG: nicotinate (nicotinamide) nucleotide adenylyltransferase [Gemmatimonadales bacterium]
MPARLEALRIGIFGGSFDPVHLGHVAAVSAAQQQLALDLVLVVPAGVQPFKLDAGASPEHRLAMLRLAFEDVPYTEIDSCEIERGGLSYTVDTVEEVRNRFPSHQLCLLVGADTARELPKWHRFDDLRRMVRIVVLSRPGTESPEGDLEFVAIPDVPTSATEIREALGQGRANPDVIPERVLHYMREHGLYGLKE